MKKSIKTQPGNPIIHEVVDLMRNLLHAMLTASVPAWLDVQLSLPQLRTLFIVAHNGKSSVMRISKQLGVGEPTASHLVDKLMQSGFVVRNTDPADRRRAIVQLSPEGEELITKILGWEDFLKGRLDKIDAKNLTFLRDGLKAIIPESTDK